MFGSQTPAITKNHGKFSKEGITNNGVSCHINQDTLKVFIAFIK